MDKRWIYIIIIAVIGIGCLYLIAESSTTIGSANINVNKFIISIPSSFNIEKSGGDNIRLINRANEERINIGYLGKIPDINQNMTNKMNSLSSNENITVIKNTTIKLNNAVVPSIYYEKSPDNTVSQIAFITKYDHSFMIECANFKDNETIKENLELLNETLKRDFKQKQD